MSAEKPNFNINVSKSDFYTIRNKNYYYIDKTKFIEELITYAPDGISLITRPRRFGKTLTLSMLNEFFSIKNRNDKNIFDGLEIDKNKKICNEWQNKFPVLSISLKDLNKFKYESTLYIVSDLIHDLCIEHSYLLESKNVSDSIKSRIQNLLSGNPTENDLALSLKTISQALYFHYNCSVIVLIDEYDVSLNYAYNNNYYDEMLDFFRTFFGALLKDNPYIQLAVLTGCLRIAKESVFTGFNNFRCYSIYDDLFSDKFGFTDSEIDKILEDTNLLDKKQDIKEWYDGYTFGSVNNIYCPWNVLNYVFDVQYQNITKPKLYWINTSENKIVQQLIEKADIPIDNKRQKIEDLLSGGSINVDIDENITFRNLYRSENTFFNVLLMTGYLTKKDCNYYDNSVKLAIPNKEIKTIIKIYVNEWFKEKIKSVDRKDFFQAFWDGNEKTVEEIISDFLLQYISYYDSHYEFCHGFVAGLFIGSGYKIHSNKEYGDGRPDIVVYDEKNNRLAIIEVKHTNNIDSFRTLARKALQQILTSEYDKLFEKEGYTDILHCGLAFFKKRCNALFFKR